MQLLMTHCITLIVLSQMAQAGIAIAIYILTLYLKLSPDL